MYFWYRDYNVLTDKPTEIFQTECQIEGNLK